MPAFFTMEAALEPPMQAKKDHVCRVAARPLAGQPLEPHRATNSLYFQECSSGTHAVRTGSRAGLLEDAFSLGSKARLFAMLAADACRVAADRRRSHRLYDAPSLALPKSGETIAPVGSQFQVSLWVNM